MAATAPSVSRDVVVELVERALGDQTASHMLSGNACRVWRLTRAVPAGGCISDRQADVLFVALNRVDLYTTLERVED